MSRIRMAVEIRNESGVPLIWQRDELEVGDWTRPWYPSRGATVAPETSTEWRAEGGLLLAPTTGTEGRVWYNVDGDPGRQLYVHFNSPLIESQYGNTFHIWAPPGFEVAHWGGQGHEARLTIRFRQTARREVAGFTPSRNGFQFDNSWNADLPAMTVGQVWNHLLDHLGSDAAERLGIGRVDDDWLPFTHADSGLCGGMVFAAMDYFFAGQAPPPITVTPTSAADPLFQMIRERLLDSFDVTGSGHRWLGYSSPHYPNGDEGFIQVVGLARGRAWVSYREEWPRIRDDIDSGRPSPVGLIQTDSLDIGKNHQVLAYAYEQSGQDVRLWVYDPNEPGNDAVGLEFNITDTAAGIDVRRFGYPSPQPRVFAIIRTDGYEPRRLPAVWRPPFPIAPPGHAVPGAVTALSRIPDHLDVFWVGPDGGIGTTYWNPAEGWHAPFPIAPPGHAAAGAVTALSRIPDHLDVFWVGPDGGIGTTYWNPAEGWHAPFPIAPPGHAAAGAVTALSRIPDHLDVFWVGPDGGIGTTYWG